MISPDGKCKTFDAGANGYVRGEGAGAIVVKSLRKAEEDWRSGRGGPILAIVRGSALNQVRNYPFCYFCIEEMA